MAVQTESSPSGQTQAAGQGLPPRLSEKEERLVKRLVAKYSSAGCPLLKSLLIFTLLVSAGHGIEQSGLPGWAAFLLVYLPTLWMFSKYRKFGILKSRLLCKLAVLAGCAEAPPGLFDAAKPSSST